MADADTTQDATHGQPSAPPAPPAVATSPRPEPGEGRPSDGEPPCTFRSRQAMVKSGAPRDGALKRRRGGPNNLRHGLYGVTWPAGCERLKRRQAAYRHSLRVSVLQRDFGPEFEAAITRHATAFTDAGLNASEPRHQRKILRLVVDELGHLIDFATEDAIDVACDWLKHKLLAARWSEEKAESLTPDQKLRFSREQAVAATERNKIVRELRLEKKPMDDYDRMMARHAAAIEAQRAARLSPPPPEKPAGPRRWGRDDDDDDDD